MLAAPTIREVTNVQRTGLKKSSFLITINSNLKAPTQAEADAIGAIMRDIITGSGQMFSKEHLPLMIQFLAPGGNASKIEKADVQFGIEVGDKEKRPHAHIVLNLYHRTKLHMDPQYIKEWFTKQMNKRLLAAGRAKLNGFVYVNIRAIKTAWDVEEYLKKTG